MKQIFAPLFQQFDLLPRTRRFVQCYLRYENCLVLHFFFISGCIVHKIVLRLLALVTVTVVCGLNQSYISSMFTN